MSGIKGQIRTPRAPVRERRNFTGLADFAQFVGGGSVIIITETGILDVDLADDGGLDRTGDDKLQVKLDSNPGLATSATGLTAVVTAPLTLGGSGIGLSTGDGLTLTGGALEADLGDGLTITAGAIEVNAGAGLGLGATVFVDIPGQTELATVDGAADYFLVYDADAGGLKKVLGNNLPGGGGTTVITTKGDLRTHDGSSLVRLPVGSDGDILKANSAVAAGIEWQSPSTASSPTSTKGDLEVHDGSSLVRLPVGSDGQVLKANSGEAEGVAWEAESGGGADLSYATKIAALNASSHWPLNDASPLSTAADAIGSNDGTYNNTGDLTAQVDGAIAGDSADAITAGTGSGYADLGAPAAFQFTDTDDFAVLIWTRVQSGDAGWLWLKGINNSGDAQLGVFTNNGDLAVKAFVTTGTGDTAISNSFADGEFHAILMNVNGSNGTYDLIVDGVYELEGQALGSAVPTEAWWLFAGQGTGGGATFTLEGTQHHFAIFPGYLKPRAVAALMRGSSVG